MGLKPYLMKGLLFLIPIFLGPLILVGILYCSPFAVFAPPLSEEQEMWQMSCTIAVFGILEGT